MEIIAVINQKGGVGKTTSTANIGSGLTILGKRVLLVDLDPQAHLGKELGVANGGFEHTIYNVLRGDVELKDVFIRKELGARIAKPETNEDTDGNGDGEGARLYVTIAPASIDLSGADMEFAGRHGKEYLLRDSLEKVTNGFDYALIDCPPKGVRHINGVWQVKGRDRNARWRDTPATSAEEAKALRDRMLEGGVL